DLARRVPHLPDTFLHVVQEGRVVDVVVLPLHGRDDHRPELGPRAGRVHRLGVVDASDTVVAQTEVGHVPDAVAVHHGGVVGGSSLGIRGRRHQGVDVLGPRATVLTGGVADVGQRAVPHLEPRTTTLSVYNGRILHEVALPRQGLGQHDTLPAPP